MSNTATGRPHPLFDPGSMYRLGSELSIWSDGGVGSIRRFYESLRLDYVDRLWYDPYTVIPADGEPWDWGYDEETNRRIHTSRLQERQALNAEEDKVRQAALKRMKQTEQWIGKGAEASEFSLPSMIAYDLDEKDLGNPTEVRRNPNDMFPGLKESDRPPEKSDPQDELKLREFWMRIRVGAEQEGRSCVALLLTRGLVERLAGVLEQQTPLPRGPRLGLPTRRIRDQQDVIEVVGRVLAPIMLEPSEEAPEVELWRASRLSLILSCAPGLQGKIKGGLFNIDRFLLSDNPDRKFPHMPGDTWLIRCLGGRDV